jgi:integrase/recombinase XerD
MSKPFKSCLRTSIARYLKLMEGLGRRFASERRILELLDQFLTGIEARSFGRDHFDAWCATLGNFCSTVRRNHMRVVRNFCIYRQRHAPRSFVPSTDHFPPLGQSIRPYWFSEQDIRRLLHTCEEVGPVSRAPLRPQAYRLAIVLLYTTGLRRGELLRLTLRDYDAQGRTLFIRKSKFNKSRFLVLSEDAQREVDEFLSLRRARGLSIQEDVPLLCRGKMGLKGYSGGHLRTEIHDLMAIAGIRKPDGRVPRIHDFRHGFAISVLLRSYAAGHDVQSRLPLLCTYMGHKSIVATSHYLSFLPPLAEAASERFRDRYGDLIHDEGARHA